MATEHTIEVTDATWTAEVVQSDVPVLVDFWAEWCAPCKALSPIIDEIAGETTGKLKVAKVDVATNQQIAGQLGIRNLPTLLVFSGGTVKEQMVGAMSKADLQQKIAAHI